MLILSSNKIRPGQTITTRAYRGPSSSTANALYSKLLAMKMDDRKLATLTPGVSIRILEVETAEGDGLFEVTVRGEGFEEV